MLSNVMAEMAKALFDPAGIHGKHAHMAQTVRFASVQQGFVDAFGEFSRKHHLISQLPKKGTADDPAACMGDINFAGSRKGEGTA